MKSKSGKNSPLATKAETGGKLLNVGLRRGEGQEQHKIAKKAGGAVRRGSK